MALKAVIFDMGGVLVRTEDRSPRTRLAERLGMSYAELEAVVWGGDRALQASLGKTTTDQHWQYIASVLGLSPEKIHDLQGEFFAGDRVDSSLVDLLRSLRPRYRTALLSNAFDDLRRVLATKWKIIDAFDEIVISAEVGMVKPGAEIYRLTVKRLGVKPAEAVFIDDFFENIEGARRVGLQAIHFTGPEQARIDLINLLDGANQ